MNRELGLAATTGAFLPTSGNDHRSSPTHHVLELRQYKIVHNKRDEFVQLFDECFVESQEAVGMQLVGQFRDLEDPNRFTWIRSFADMTSRGEQLTTFYDGPVWLANRDRANPMLDDNDNVLLLRPAGPEFAIVPITKRPAIGAQPTTARPVLASIEYLWKTPDEGFTSFFESNLLPALRQSGLAVLGAYVPEEEENNFPRLPVRPDRKLFVWFATAHDRTAMSLGLDELRHNARNAAVLAKLDDFQERPPQLLWLDPTARSALR